MIGQRFGRLTVLQYVPAPRKTAYRGRWVLCTCECGAVKPARVADLKSGGTKSCGCYGREQAAKALKRNNKHFITGYQKPPGMSELRQRINHYKCNARPRGLSWELPDDVALRLMTSACHYCGAPPTMKARRVPARQVAAPTLFNGLDRVDNALGYTVANTVPCCRTCNHMKSDRTVSQWFEHMSAVFAHSWKFP